MPKCFVISPIGDPASDTRKRSDGFLREVIRPVAEEHGFVVERADEDKAPGMVTEGIVNKIIDADLVIADLHAHNPNVMYEVAIRHATDKPLVQMIEIGESVPFDIGGLNTIFYDPSVVGLAQWRADLRASIGAIDAGVKGSNPVARAGLMRTLDSVPGGEGVALTTLLEEVQRLRYEVRATRSTPAAQGADRSRVLLRPEQYMMEALTRFLTTQPSLDGKRFVVDARDKRVEVAVLPSTMEGPVTTLHYEFKYAPEASIGDEILRIQAEILRDIENAERAVPDA